MTDEWTSMDVERPDDDVSVLCFDQREQMFVGYRAAGFWYDYTGDLHDLPVTHWMDLPEEPE